MTEQFPEEDETAEGLNLAPRRLSLLGFVWWMYKAFAELANRQEPLPDDGVLVGPDDKTGDRDKSIWATSNEFRFREMFAGLNHRVEWWTILATIAYLMKSGTVRAPTRPGPGPSPTAGAD